MGGLAHDVERPVTLPTSCFTQLLPKSNLLDVPNRSLDLDHIYVNNSFALIPDSLSALVECSAFCTFKASFAGMKASQSWIIGGTSKKERVCLDCAVNRSFVSVDVYLLVSSPLIWKNALHTGDRKWLATALTTCSHLRISSDPFEEHRLTQNTIHSRRRWCQVDTCSSAPPVQQERDHDQAYHLFRA